MDRPDWDFGREKATDWKPDKYTTKCCGDVIWSERPGQFKQCKCGEAFVDQTRYYTRLSGQFEEDTEESDLTK